MGECWSVGGRSVVEACCCVFLVGACLVVFVGGRGCWEKRKKRMEVLVWRRLSWLLEVERRSGMVVVWSVVEACDGSWP